MHRAIWKCQLASRVGHLEAVHGQAAARLLVAILEVADDRVVHVLLLLAQEVRRHRVQAVAGQLVVALSIA